MIINNVRVYISIVSHNHSELIKNLGCIDKLIEKYTVVIKSNTSKDDFEIYEENDCFHWINRCPGKGFGENNNIVFQYCKNELNMQDDDIFLVMNPDVKIEVEELDRLINLTSLHKDKLATINLFKDEKFTQFDNAIRKFPDFLDFFKSFLFSINPTILDKAIITKKSNIDWAAGSFLCFNANHYESLSGFDENYFMYCEDIDICLRSKYLGHPLVYYPEIRAVHFAEQASRKLFSKHFVWHISSVARYLKVKNRFKG